MKSFIWTTVILCLAATAGTLVYLNRPTTPPAPLPAVASPPPQEKIVTANAEPPRATSEVAGETAPTTGAPRLVNESRREDAINPVRKGVDDLLSAKSRDEKQAVFKQLVKSGQLDGAIEELKQRAADNSNDPEIPTTLGEAQLYKLRTMAAAGGDYNEIGILAMQADQSFNAALKLDPQNWEAQFMKAASMSRWPADATRDSDVVQRLSSLIDQQEAMASLPAFAQTYVVLGEQYQKIGKPDYAQQTWQLGLAKFPNDPALQKKVSQPARQ